MRDARYNLAETPAERLAAICARVVHGLAGTEPYGQADYADFAEALEPFVAHELIVAKLEEALVFGNAKRIQELGRELAFSQSKIAGIEERK
jgi:hypothetical protein